MTHLVNHLRAFLDRELEPLAHRSMVTPAQEHAIPTNIAKVPLKSWDKGVFSSELVKLHIVPSVNVEELDEGKAESEVGPGQIEEVSDPISNFILAIMEIL